jgi:integrase/recombinase XerD
VGPTRLDQAQRILGIPFKRTRSRPIAYLEHEEIAAVLAGVDRSTRAGRRDYALVATMFNTGARVQEILDLRASDLQLTQPYQLRLVGKGQTVRWCPLWPQTARLLRAWCTERQVDLRSDARVFVNHRGLPLTRFGVRFILAKHIRQASQRQSSLTAKKLHPHSLRHSTAVHLLKSGVDLPTIAHWLGHASVNTTNCYVTVDLELKRKALARAAPLGTSRPAAPWRRDISVLEWLEAL